MSLSLKELMHDFTQLHQHEKNVLLHKIGIPAMMLGALILLSWISISIGGKIHIAFSWLAVAGILTFYYRINVKLAAAMTVLLVVMTLIAVWIGYPKPTAFNLILFFVLFFGGLATMFMGHSFEKEGMKVNLRFCHFLAAPLFMTIVIIQALKLESYFELSDLNSSKPKQG